MEYFEIIFATIFTFILCLCVSAFLWIVTFDLIKSMKENDREAKSKGSAYSKKKSKHK